MSYFSKLLLFGEYTVIQGSQALAAPLELYKGQWKYAIPPNRRLQQQLPVYLEYLKKLQSEGQLQMDLDIPALEVALQKGLFFDSNIPEGYGVGSSGALCAGIYERFVRSKISKKETSRYTELKSVFSQLENFFHGASSGADPLICYLQQAILIAKDQPIHPVSLPKLPDDACFFLLDTGIKRKTGPLVDLFLKKCEDPAFQKAVWEGLSQPADWAISALLESQWMALFNAIQQISQQQWALLQEMIPKAYKSLWEESLKAEDYQLKLCGAGGGGFILGYTKDWAAVKPLCKSYRIYRIPW